MATTYEYSQASEPDFACVYRSIVESAMTSKAIAWCQWDDNTDKLFVAFESELSSGDKTILDGIVSGLDSLANQKVTRKKQVDDKTKELVCCAYCENGYTTANTVIETVVDGGQTLKINIDAAEDQPTLDAIVDTR